MKSYNRLSCLNNRFNYTPESLISLQTSFRKKWHILLLFIIVFISATSYSVLAQTTHEKNWILIKQQDNVLAFYRVEECGENNFLLLKLQNQGNKNVHISWVIEAIQTASNAAPIQPGYLSILRSQEIAEGSCANAASPLTITLPQNTSIQKMAIHLNVTNSNY